ncbi:HlyD family secretion protein [Stutzerimonas stutzeri]|jgi:membrane fusion protein, multidrug efflux system|uniref:Membrane fusion protein (Multidrug efflux system) n=1 Tax=Stutzerimonas stutzeri TaxID=316 RepID=A0A5S5BEE2_STUST|nr:HlyD family secretion protein [Stutzerimonas stutzeri]TYP65411.1 membrane fusion protein (multidrug efflux system) [Stutzerimonas stutzeri]
MPAKLKRRLFIFIALVLLVAAAFFAHWYFVGRYYEHTDNAYVQGEITRVSSQLPARIEQVHVQDNQHVKPGDLLVTLEPGDFRLALEQARANFAIREAELAQARSRLAQQSSTIAASQASVGAAQANLERSQMDLSRVEALRKPGFISEERVSTLSADAKVARSQRQKAEADLAAQRQQVEALDADVKRLQAQIASAQAEIEQAELNLSRTEIRSPISGIVGQRLARSGQYVPVGAYLMSIVPDEDIWVQANFKETQIGPMQEGQRVELTFDSYPDTPIEGRVESLSPASGAQFSLLPPDNATGNFTKVVQRIPVKVTFANDNPLKGRIRPGMSVDVKIDIRGR